MNWWEEKNGGRVGPLAQNSRVFSKYLVVIPVRRGIAPGGPCKQPPKTDEDSLVQVQKMWVWRVHRWLEVEKRGMHRKLVSRQAPPDHSYQYWRFSRFNGTKKG